MNYRYTAQHETEVPEVSTRVLQIRWCVSTPRWIVSEAKEKESDTNKLNCLHKSACFSQSHLLFFCAFSPCFHPLAVFCSSWWAWLQVISSAYSFLFALLSFKYFSWKNLCHFDVLCKTKWACQNVAFFQICFKGQILYCLPNLIKFPPISMSSPCICSI